MRGNIEALGAASVAGKLQVEGRLGDIIAVGVDLARRIEQFGWVARLSSPLLTLGRFKYCRTPDAAAISHCDVSNDFYALWLDWCLVYSCLLHDRR